MTGISTRVKNGRNAKPAEHDPADGGARLGARAAAENKRQRTEHGRQNGHHHRAQPRHCGHPHRFLDGVAASTSSTTRIAIANVIATSFMNLIIMTDKFLIDDASRISGLTVTMIDYLCHETIVVPTASRYRTRGKPRMYGYADVVMLRTVMFLLDRGVSVSRMKPVLKSIRKRYPLSEMEELQDGFIVTNGVWAKFQNKNSTLQDVKFGEQFDVLHAVNIGKSIAT
jgi:DNA-binding transcriptional MerR regulator